MEVHSVLGYVAIYFAYIFTCIFVSMYQLIYCLDTGVGGKWFMPEMWEAILLELPQDVGGEDYRHETGMSAWANRIYM